MWKRCTLFQKTPTQSNSTDTQSCLDFAEGNGVKNTTLKIRFMAEKLHLLAPQKKKNQKSYHIFLRVVGWLEGGAVLPLINTSTGLENELPAMMLGWAAYTFTIFTSGAAGVGRLVEPPLCPRCKMPPGYHGKDQRQTQTHTHTKAETPYVISQKPHKRGQTHCGAMLLHVHTNELSYA